MSLDIRALRADVMKASTYLISAQQAILEITQKLDNYEQTHLGQQSPAVSFDNSARNKKKNGTSSKTGAFGGLGLADTSILKSIETQKMFDSDTDEEPLSAEVAPVLSSLYNENSTEKINRATRGQKRKVDAVLQNQVHVTENNEDTSISKRSRRSRGSALNTASKEEVPVSSRSTRKSVEVFQEKKAKEGPPPRSARSSRATATADDRSTKNRNNNNSIEETAQRSSSRQSRSGTRSVANPPASAASEKSSKSKETPVSERRRSSVKSLEQSTPRGRERATPKSTEPPTPSNRVKPTPKSKERPTPKSKQRPTPKSKQEANTKSRSDKRKDTPAPKSRSGRRLAPKSKITEDDSSDDEAVATKPKGPQSKRGRSRKINEVKLYAAGEEDCEVIHVNKVPEKYLPAIKVTRTSGEVSSVHADKGEDGEELQSVPVTPTRHIKITKPIDETSTDAEADNGLEEIPGEVIENPDVNEDALKKHETREDETEGNTEVQEAEEYPAENLDENNAQEDDDTANVDSNSGADGSNVEGADDNMAAEVTNGDDGHPHVNGHENAENDPDGALKEVGEEICGLETSIGGIDTGGLVEVGDVDNTNGNYEEQLCDSNEITKVHVEPIEGMLSNDDLNQVISSLQEMDQS